MPVTFYIMIVTFCGTCRSGHIDRTTTKQPRNLDLYSMYHSKALQEELRRLDAQEHSRRHG